MTSGGPQLHALVFDIDDTLYSTTEFSQIARRNSVRAMIAAGLQIDEEEGYAELMEVVAEFSSNYPNHFARFLDRLGPDRHAGHNPAVITAAGVVAYHRTKEEGMRLLPDVRATLEVLHRAEVRMGILSAGLRVKQAEKLIRLGALRFFDPRSIFFTDQMGISKPNPKLFLKAADIMGLAPDRLLYIGDNPTNDVTPARSVGMHTVLYTGAHGKYCPNVPIEDAHHQLDDLTGLLAILRDDYDLPV